MTLFSRTPAGCTRLATLTWAAIALLALSPVMALSQMRVIGYYPMWNRAGFPAREVRFDYLTHIMHAFAWPDANGVISSYDASADTALINATHRAGRKILISLGGAAESSAFPALVADSSKRHAFVSNVVQYVTANGYDGADLDWEGPQNSTDRANEVLMITELRAAFNVVDPALQITMAVGAGNWSGQWHDYTALSQQVDWFNAMCYDFHGSWSSHAGHNAPLYAPAFDVNDGSDDLAITYLHVTRGIPNSQIAMGMPFYGKEFLATAMYAPQTGETDIFYADVLSWLAHNWTYVWDTVSQVPYLVAPSGTKVVTFDDSLSLTLKCEYARTKQLSGVMIWALGQDFISQRQPLMEAVGKAVYGTSSVIAGPVIPVERRFALLGNYPNPFNPSTTIEYSIPVRSVVRLRVFNILGEEIANLADGLNDAGRYRESWNAAGFPSGVYFYRIEATAVDGSGSSSGSGKMALVK